MPPRPSSMARLVLGDLPICLIHADDGRFYAIEDRCSHEDYALSEGELDGTRSSAPVTARDSISAPATSSNPPAVLPVATFAVELTMMQCVDEVAG